MPAAEGIILLERSAAGGESGAAGFFVQVGRYQLWKKFSPGVPSETSPHKQ